MTKFGLLQSWRPTLIASLLALSCMSSWAARDFTPQSGTWIVSSEINGKPGRGLAIDVQGNTFFMQVFGYEKNGDATFYTATGQMEGNSITAPLMRYKNGRSLAGPMQEAVEDRSVGQVTVSFRNGLRGTLQFPGESAVAIERLLVTSDAASVTNPLAQQGGRSLRLFTLDAQGQPDYTTQAQLWRTDDGITQVGWFKPSVIGMVVYQPLFQCGVLPGTARMQCTPKDAERPADIADIESMELLFAGFDIQGELRIGGSHPHTRIITGFDLGASLSEASYVEGRTTITPVQHHSYLASNFGYGPVCQVYCDASVTTNILMPMNGTWVVEDELTGKPGRGIALDVQGDTVILQLFHYRADGQPTFHMGSAIYQGKGAGSRASVATIPLREYRGGRSLGGPAKAAELEAEAGNAIVEFYSPPLESGAIDRNVWWTQGQLQLPGEPPVKIRRLQIDVPASFAERMFGDWYARSGEVVTRFDRVQGEGVITADGKLLCLPVGLTPGANMSCGEPDGNQWRSHYSTYLPDMGRSGPFLRLRDRFGNATGLGAPD